jgi:hypothetical protein
MNEPDAVKIINAGKHRRKPASQAVVMPSPEPLSPVVANPFADETGNSLADDGQRVV